jgi:intein/homing endonuclease
MEEKLRNLFIDQDLTIAEIAKMFNKSRITITRLLRKHSISKQTRYEDFIDIETLISLKKEGYTHKQIAEKLNITIAQSKKCYSANTIKADHSINEAKIDKNNKIFWYLIGFYLADGHADTGKSFIKISQKYPQILNKLKDYYESKGTLYKSNAYTLTLKSPKLISILEEMNLVGNKTYTCKMPEVPKEFLWHFLRGYFDGDGCIYYNYVSGRFMKVAYQFVTGSENFANSLSELLKDYQAVVRKETSTVFRISIDGENNVVRFGNNLYKDIFDKMYIEEKYTKFLKLKDLIQLNNSYKTKI